MVCNHHLPEQYQRAPLGLEAATAALGGRGGGAPRWGLRGREPPIPRTKKYAHLGEGAPRAFERHGGVSPKMYIFFGTRGAPAEKNAPPKGGTPLCRSPSLPARARGSATTERPARGGGGGPPSAPQRGGGPRKGGAEERGRRGRSAPR